MLKNLKIWQKLSLIVVAFSVPIGVLLHFLVTEQNIILVKGAIPGPKGSLVLVRTAAKKTAKKGGK